MTTRTSGEVRLPSSKSESPSILIQPFSMTTDLRVSSKLKSRRAGSETTRAGSSSPSALSELASHLPPIHDGIDGIIAATSTSSLPLPFAFSLPSPSQLCSFPSTAPSPYGLPSASASLPGYPFVPQHFSPSSYAPTSSDRTASYAGGFEDPFRPSLSAQSHSLFPPTYPNISSSQSTAFSPGMNLAGMQHVSPAASHPSLVGSSPAVQMTLSPSAGAGPAPALSPDVNLASNQPATPALARGIDDIMPRELAMSVFELFFDYVRLPSISSPQTGLDLTPDFSALGSDAVHPQADLHRGSSRAAGHARPSLSHAVLHCHRSDFGPGALIFAAPL